mmetsp:Transcript_15774/g.24535  ORF Transcript_15774/g.24535 Transcript_15774/m.24535 type:complete len:255 (+) Transcript_15774:49-813(+)|eukprot:CAMPEP_0184294704 /NCGR_PEP_ID=MMETSP1049-20130417/5827_1 /TAXON_ID=77928 /ORGANISM="Proteomonas sulcata, Strain CCMP704" /LENGTH=254 /DNA_ID=CAMNT_0026603071 /DNA_START=30 /DNA_END=794 /DNA_ORIENTATION=-
MGELMDKQCGHAAPDVHAGRREIHEVMAIKDPKKNGQHIISAIQENQNQARAVKMLELKRAIDEGEFDTDECENSEEETLLNQLREQRIQELVGAATNDRRQDRRRQVHRILKSQIKDEVYHLHQNRGIWIVAHLFKDMTHDSRLVHEASQELAERHHEQVKFLEIYFADILPTLQPPQLPTVLIWRDGELLEAYNGLEELGVRGRTKRKCPTAPLDAHASDVVVALEKALESVGALSTGRTSTKRRHPNHQDR